MTHKNFKTPKKFVAPRISKILLKYKPKVLDLTNVEFRLVKAFSIKGHHFRNKS